MKRAWSKIVNSGMESHTSYKLSKKIRLTNVIAGSSSLISFLYVFVYYFAGFLAQSIAVIAISAAFFASVIFNHYKLYTFSRSWLILMINASLYLYATFFGKASGLHLTFLLCVVIPWLLFDIRYWRYIILFMTISMAGFFIYDATSGQPTVAIAPEMQRVIYIGIISTIFVGTGMLLGFLTAQNNEAEKYLLDTYKQFFEDIPTPMWILDSETLDFLAVNKIAIEKYGYSKEEFLNMKVMGVRPEEDKQAVIDFIKEKFHKDTLDAGYIRHKRKDGKTFYVHILSNKTVYKGRNARVALAIDVNDKVLTDKRNKELNITLTKANEELQVSKENLETQEEELRQINEELTQQTEELKASEEELKTQEEELRQINAEMERKADILEEAHKELESKAVELEAASRYKSEFLANMSHELRTPLNSVMILATLLKENKTKNLTEKQIEYARIIHKSGGDLLNLINDILDLSKIEAGKVEIHHEQVRVTDIAYDMEQLFTVLANEKKIHFEIKLDHGIPELISTDRQRAEQILKNLLANAFKFTPAGGKVTLSFSNQEDYLSIAVIDTGIGIPAEKQQLIFEAFQQADGSTTRRFGGTGLGLSISKELIKRLDGAITVSSKTDIGSTFTVYLPVKRGTALPKPDIRPPMPVVTYNPEKVKQQTIVADDKLETKPGEQSLLIIEDDPVFATHVKKFAQQRGYKTIVAISGDEGIFYARKYKPAAIILDLGLPVIDGRNVLNIIKSDKDLKHIPVHVVTADDRPDLPVGSIESYIQKPVKTNELERAFSDIETYIHEHYKSILIVSLNDDIILNMFETLTSEKNEGVVYDTVMSFEDAEKAASQKQYDCIIADIGPNLQKGIASLEELKKISGEHTYIITCLEEDISSTDEKNLKKYANSVIRKSTLATNRLMDEVELFLHKVSTAAKIEVPASYGQEFDNSLNGKKVLIADDDMRNIFALTALLEQQGMTVIAAEDGKEALDMLEHNNDVDIVLMDLMMPGMDGYEAIKHIRANEKYRKLPVLALTAKAMADDREKSIMAGASDYITKPVDNNKLFSLMRVWLTQ